MSAVRIVDTSVFCNIIGVPNRCQRQVETLQAFKRFRAEGDDLLLPTAAVYETGNHIAQEGDGQSRRQAGVRFAKQVRKAMKGESPFDPTQIHDADEVHGWLEQFPDDAMRGIGIGDRSIITVWDTVCEQTPSRRIVIWTYDDDLSGYDREPQI